MSINYTNRLDETTTMHGHGMHVPADMDGVDDIPLVLQDRFFDTNGQIDYSPSRREIMMGYHGDIFITNGVINAYVDIPNKEVRFRLLNGSNSTVYDLAFDDGRSFKQIGTDNSLLESPANITRLRLSPAERAEIVVDFSSDLNKTILFKDVTQNKNFLEVKVTKETTNNTTTPNTLTTLNRHTLDQAVRTRTFSLSASGPGDFRINGVSMKMNVINERVPLNEVEIWEVTNTMGMNHNFHIHDSHFIIAKRNGSEANVLENEKGYKDTVFIPANENVTLLVKMTDFTSSTKPYMYHCHFLEHEDAGMMGQFTVE